MLDLLLISFGEVLFADSLLILLKTFLAVISLHICDESCHQLVHSHWDIVSLFLRSHFVSESLQVLFESYECVSDGILLLRAATSASFGT